MLPFLRESFGKDCFMRPSPCLYLFIAVKIAKDMKPMIISVETFPSPNTISVSGKGEILAKADIANFTFSVIEESLNVSSGNKRRL